MAKALILGSTGLVGSHLLKKILEDNSYEEVTIWVRKDTGLTHPKLKTIITDFRNLPETEAEIVFSCLGTTRKKTPDPAVYRFIEVSVPVNTALALLKTGMRQFHYISSLGTNAKSRGSYLQNKWAAESALQQSGIPSLYLYRPSLIFGERKEKRILEGAFNALLNMLEPLLQGTFKKYRRISAETIAESMLKNAKKALPGVHVLESDEIQKSVS